MLALLLVLALPAAAQQPGAPSGQTTPPAAPAQGSSGLLEDIGKLLKAPIDMLPSPSRQGGVPAPEASPGSATGEAPPAPSAPTASSRLLPGVVTGREICLRSPNGAPDCKSGADKLCQASGYKEGNSLSTDSHYSCSTKPMRALLSGKREGKLCGTENYVTRAFCQ